MTHNRATTHRPEVDGLRAIAVLSVMFHHAGFKAFSGGFVGVDVFFVISGYLITAIILREYESGTFSALRFYERRMRRIVPALLAMIVGCIPLALMWLSASELREFAQSLVGIAASASNIYFWRESGYFATANELRPMLHTWSLAVEEQFYLLYPLLLGLLVRHRRVSLGAALTGLTLAGLLLAEILTRWSQSAAFYLLPGRAWELLAGACLAVWESRPLAARDDAARPFRDGAVAAAGAGLLAYSLFAFNATLRFPGVRAVVPVCGTILLIGFAHQTTLVGRFLSLRPLVGIGLVSYSLYLWHQPLLAFARVRALQAPEPWALFPYLGMSLVLAFTSWRLIERPFRDVRRFKSRTIWGLGAFGLAAVLMAGMLGHLGAGHGIGNPDISASVTASFAAGPTDPSCGKNLGLRPLGEWECTFGEGAATPAFAVFGDSHALSLLPAFQEVGRQRGQRGLFAARSTCPLLDGIHRARDPGCAERIARSLTQLRAHGVRTVFMVARWSQYTNGDYRGLGQAYLGTSPTAEPDRAAALTAFELGLSRTLDSLAAWGIRPVIVLQVPQQQFHARRIYARASASADAVEEFRNHSVLLKQHGALQYESRAIIGRIAALREVTVLNLDSLYCDHDRCLVGTPVGSYYKDHDHLSRVGARRATSMLAAQLP